MGQIKIYDQNRGWTVQTGIDPFNCNPHLNPQTLHPQNLTAPKLAILGYRTSVCWTWKKRVSTKPNCGVWWTCKACLVISTLDLRKYPPNSPSSVLAQISPFPVPLRMNPPSCNCKWVEAKKNRLFLPRQLRNKNLPSQANRARSCLCNVTTKGSEIHQIRTKWHPTYCGNPSILSSVPYNLRGYRPTASFSEAFRKYGQDYYKESPPRTAELNLHTTTLTIRLRIYISKHPVNVHSEKKDQT